MGFLEDFGKKVTDAGQRAIQKTQEMSESARIHSLISQNENKINDVYCQIGKLFVSIYSDDCKPEFAGMVETVIALEEQNIAYRKQIQDIKGIRHCEKCGAEVPKGGSFCSSCGTVVPKDDSHAVTDGCMKCPGCGAVVKSEMRFCTVCGRPLTHSGDGSDDTEVEVTSELVAEVPAEAEKECKECGAEASADSIFCTECGARL